MKTNAEQFSLREDQLKAIEKQRNGEPSTLPCPYVSLSQADVDLAASEGDSPEHQRARKAVAGYYYLTTPGLLGKGVADTEQNRKAKLQQDLTGIDLSKPLRIVEMPDPETMTQYKRKPKKAGLGNFFDPLGNQTGSEMGVNDHQSYREKVVCTLPKDPPKIRGLNSTAAPIVDKWTNPKYPQKCKGGGEQMNVPHEALERITWETPES